LLHLITLGFGVNQNEISGPSWLDAGYDLSATLPTTTSQDQLNLMVAAIADGKVFRNGRQFAAWLGLVPRQHSSGDKQRLLGITKRGDPYLRMLLVHGARSVVYRSAGKPDRRNLWIAEKQRKLGTTKACVALANKNARIIWALLPKEEQYRTAA
jgi:hypothetical protein